VTGAPNSLLRHARYLSGAGHSVDVWTYRDGPLRAEYEKAGFIPKVVEDSRDAVRSEFAKDGKYDLIVCNTIRTYRAADVLQRCGIPVVWFVRETLLLDEDMWVNPDFARVFRSFYNLYTVSEYNAGIVRRYNPDVRVVHNSVVDRFSGYPEIGGGVRFGYIGSIMPVKGVDVLLEAFSEVKADMPGCSLKIAGRPWTDFGKDVFSRYRDAPGVEWLGEVRGEAKDSFFGGIDVLCVPSLDEPSGLTVIEGTMYGKAIVTTDRTGANYLVSAANGRIVAAGDGNSLAKAMLELARSREGLPEMQRRSRERYLEDGTPDAERAAVLRMLEDNLGKPPAVKHRLGSDRVNPVFHEDRTLSGHRRFYLFGIKVFSCRGKGVYEGSEIGGI
jgi:glycosyltransferase involved in cell wall biosynthesis